jgi:C4-dicarboxylate transporter DctM subunit|tara:strand:- start:49233 stop:50516 length:1284 start_codon:yes stop_codon:yes gene_type:complete
MILSLVVLPALLLVFGLPIFFVLLSSSLLTIVFFMNIPLSAVHQNLLGSISSTGLLAVPFFIFAGELMSRGTISARLVDFVKSIFGRLPGALGVTTVGTATLYGAISGSSAASVVSVGKVMLPALRKGGYSEKMSGGMIASVSAIGIIIPPSVPMIIYGAASETSIPRLYAAGVFPGLLLAIVLSLYVIVVAKKKGIVSQFKFSFGRLWQTFQRAVFALGAPCIVLGGIYGGITSPTEAAAIASVYAFFVTKIIFRELSWKDIFDCARNTVVFSSQILMIVAAAGLYSWILTVNQIPQEFVEYINSLGLEVWSFLLIVNLFLLVWGCVLDPMAAILLLTPILIPIVDSLGIDKVHFGIIMTLNLAIGLFTPPFGINIYVAQSVLSMKIKDLFIGVFPFFIIFLIVLVFVTYIPQISLGSMSFFMAEK